jgi:hypothetical protein
MADSKFTEDEKTQKCLKLISETENEILKTQCDGEVTVDPYGNIEFKIYKDEVETTTTSSEGISI